MNKEFLMNKEFKVGKKYILIKEDDNENWLGVKIKIRSFILPTTPALQWHIECKILNFIKYKQIIEMLSVPANPARFYEWEEYPSHWREVVEDIKCPNCSKVVEPDMLRLCPECAWLLGEEE